MLRNLFSGSSCNSYGYCHCFTTTSCKFYLLANLSCFRIFFASFNSSVLFKVLLNLYLLLFYFVNVMICSKTQVPIPICTYLYIFHLNPIRLILYFYKMCHLSSEYLSGLFEINPLPQVLIICTASIILGDLIILFFCKLMCFFSISNPKF